jgi:chitin disaccharide deacetylase
MAALFHPACLRSCRFAPCTFCDATPAAGVAACHLIPRVSTTLAAVLRLIVNADDYGLAPGINRAVDELFDRHALTSATLMSGAAFAVDAAAFARDHPKLGVGCHLVLLDGSPLSDPASVSSLLGKDGGSMNPTLGTFVRQIFRGRIQPADIEREVTAQINRAIALGITPTHVDTHKHTHMFASVMEPVLKGAEASGITAIRNPFEPEWSVRASSGAGFRRKTEVRLLRRLQEKFLGLVRDFGFATTDGTLGIAATGSLDSATLEAILGAAPDGTYELVCHPGYVDDALRSTSTRLLDSRSTELRSLSECAALLSQRAELISYRELQP